MAEQTWDIAIIGGGIIGLASAMELLTRLPGVRLVILEKEPRVAQHQSGHNSGVIHSGIYYNPGSLKARACVAGKSRLIRFCDEHAIRYELCGKVIVATHAEELPLCQLPVSSNSLNSHTNASFPLLMSTRKMNDTSG